ncbi:2-nitropropane dioxygenase [Acetobacter orientalis]|uniref:2-nitropropane dioxygenase n=1 Tax=Acetobacter orientalis TaxID=146474 RepID=A0A2Z5ZD76_9PROT|nr:2-nitropropane dioxygenase [Acetobacter orientalis]
MSEALAQNNSAPLTEAETALARKRLNQLWKRGTDFLGTQYAILGGAMSWVSERHLVSAISNAGGFGVIACGAMQPERLAEEIAATQALTEKPFGVNLITMHPQLSELVEVCLKAGVSHIVLAGGIPPGAAIKAAKEGGRRLLRLLRHWYWLSA